MWIHSSTLFALLQSKCHKSQRIRIWRSCGNCSKYRRDEYGAPDPRNHQEDYEARFLGHKHHKCHESQILSAFSNAYVQLGISDLPPRARRRLYEVDEFLAPLYGVLLAFDHIAEITAPNRRKSGVVDDSSVCHPSNTHRGCLWRCRPSRSHVRSVLHTLH